ncbi:MAG: hypothetical protein B6D46_04505 [Polyangiaceae bacterium UTPRO1]|jgi:hypothetical protein|nr:hypothetical protein [Myxococcales bacterium]OQY68129.1 MAG: hypothetical protein B6D46_04505 [Polyangiaceae bacterium UTPRO1]
MTTSREIRYYDYVNTSYERVCEALRRDVLAVCRAATKTAASRAVSLASELHVNVGGFEIGTDIDIRLEGIEEHGADPKTPPKTTFALEWQAARMPRLFPFMHAQLVAYPLTSTETQLELVSRYDPPLGAVGAALDALVGRRIADACVHRFLTEVAMHLRQTLAG